MSIKKRNKFNKSLLAKYKQWIFDSRRGESVTAMREFVDRESEFMTTASEIIVGAIKDGPKRERTFIAEDQSSKRQRVRKCKVCKGPHSLWNCEGFKRLAVSNRWNIAKERKLCFRCLSDGHRGDTCSWNKV